MQAYSERKSFPCSNHICSNSQNMEWMENWERWWIQQRIVLPSRETSTEWRNWLRRTSQNSTTRSAKLCTWGRIILYTCMCWGLVDRLEGSFAERPWTSRWMPIWTQASNMLLWQRRLMVSWAAPEGRVSAGQRWSFPSVQHWWGPTWSAASGSGLPTTRKLKNYRRVYPAKGHQDD